VAVAPRHRRRFPFLAATTKRDDSCSLNTQRIGLFTDGVFGLGADHRCMNWNLLDIDAEAA
jgi:hypothetical protein